MKFEMYINDPYSIHNNTEITPEKLGLLVGSNAVMSLRGQSFYMKGLKTSANATTELDFITRCQSFSCSLPPFHLDTPLVYCLLNTTTTTTTTQASTVLAYYSTKNGASLRQNALP